MAKGRFGYIEIDGFNQPVGILVSARRLTENVAHEIQSETALNDIKKKFHALVTKEDNDLFWKDQYVDGAESHDWSA